MSKSDKQLQSKNRQDQHLSMQHYLYADMDFINSFLAQSGQGLHLSSFQTNSNTKSKYEDRSSSLVNAKGNAFKKSNPTLELGALGSKLGVGGDEKSNGDVTVTIEGLERGDNSNIYTGHAIQVAMHDYAINLFIESIRQQIDNGGNKSDYFLASDVEWELLDYSDTLTEKLEAYSELMATDLLSGLDDESADIIKQFAPQARAVLKIMNSTFPTPYAIRRNNKQGNLEEQWMRYTMKSIINDFGMKPKFSVLGIKTSSNKILIKEDALDDPKSILTGLSQFLDQTFLPFVTKTTNGDQIFKPIVIFRTLK
ncbi:hypothetical protein [Exiguobacterium acetylicum]|uniref:hypothetical protein n=1 Tax=Exiguobacterium acetylicum TaxID=41170 RepID=UPI001EE26923|nr:hypothetical protein [Exiguobacterium acetylicum]UKS54907.1 hypothetical protein K6T22_10115 [Exiguobacterium acetylicum]